MKKFLLAVICIFLANPVFASVLDAQQFMPANNLHLQDNVFATANVTEDQFHEVIEQAEAFYTPIFKKLGAKLIIEKKWADSTVNAYAYQSGNTWYVAMFGGLARRPEVTYDGFALVLYHEIGHHLGGFPKWNRTSGGDWAANEGNSDYYATHAAAKAIWKNDFVFGGKTDPSQGPTDPSQEPPEEPQDQATAMCYAAFDSDLDRAVCLRSINAGLSTSALLAALRGDDAPTVESRDLSVVNKTVDSHPEAQCRLDTYVAGALCNVSYDLNQIPQTESEMNAVSCATADGYEAQARPRCWFKPGGMLY